MNEMMTADNAFQEDVVPPYEVDASHEADALLLQIDGYEGPINVLLDLARNQKVDLREISILQLARQYLAFIERAKALNLELAAEYLVMAAWLAYLKSRLLLPREKGQEDEASAHDIAEALQFQLRRLEAMQKASQGLQARPQLGQGVFARGMSEKFRIKTETAWDVNLYDMLKAYGDIQQRANHSSYDLPEYNLMSMDDALSRLSRMLGALPMKGLQSAWATLESFLPEGIKDKLYGRSSLASMLTASLEMAKQGRLEIRQDGLFRPIYMRMNNHAQGAGQLEEGVSS